MLHKECVAVSINIQSRQLLYQVQTPCHVYKRHFRLYKRHSNRLTKRFPNFLQKKRKFNLSIFPGAPGSLTLTYGFKIWSQVQWHTIFWRRVYNSIKTATHSFTFQVSALNVSKHTWFAEYFLGCVIFNTYALQALSVPEVCLVSKHGKKLKTHDMCNSLSFLSDYRHSKLDGE